jgi:hypothetical protein
MLGVDVVERIAEVVRSRSGQFDRLPISIDLAISAARPHVEVLDEPRLPTEQVTTLLERGLAIFVQPTLGCGERRVALACGLGHVIFDRFFTVGPEPPMHRDFLAEERALAFALALLIPTTDLRRRLVRPVCERQLARVFAVPTSAIRARIARLPR